MHTDVVAFARGMCHKCYCKWYNKTIARDKRRARKHEKLLAIEAQKNQPVVAQNDQYGSFKTAMKENFKVDETVIQQLVDPNTIKKDNYTIGN